MSNETRIAVSLARPARKSGGDRYEGMFEDGSQFTIYVPQQISRPEGLPVAKIQVTFTPEAD